MKQLFYAVLSAFLIASALFMCSCKGTGKLSADDRKNGVIIKSKRAVVYEGNLSKYSHFGNRKNKKQ